MSPRSRNLSASVALQKRKHETITWLADVERRRNVSKSLLEQLPGIVAAGKREAERILEQLDSSRRVSLQTRELVIPSRDTSAADLFALANRVERSAQGAELLNSTGGGGFL